MLNELIFCTGIFLGGSVCPTAVETPAEETLVDSVAHNSRPRVVVRFDFNRRRPHHVNHAHHDHHVHHEHHVTVDYSYSVAPSYSVHRGDLECYNADRYGVDHHGTQYCEWDCARTAGYNGGVDGYRVELHRGDRHSGQITEHFSRPYCG
jgi:hypothetical protein